MIPTNQIRRSVFAATAVAVSLFIVWDAYRYAKAAYWFDGAHRSSLKEPADRAVEVLPDSAEARFQRAVILNNEGNHAAAIEDLMIVLDRRPEDHSAWFELGRAREQLGDIAGALEAYGQSTARAENFGYPRWRWGLMLRKSGRGEDGWKEMKRAFEADPRFLVPAVQEAWIESKGDTDATIARLEPLSDTYALIAGYYLLEKGVGLGVGKLLCRSSTLEQPNRKALVDRLIERGDFAIAAATESADCGAFDSFKDSLGTVRNGSFENDFAKHLSFLDWKFKPSKDLQISVDKGVGGEAAAKSLRIVYDGAGHGEIPVSQLVPVDGGGAYKLTFRVKTQGVVSGVRPVLVAAEGRTGKEIARSGPFAAAQNFGGVKNGTGGEKKSGLVSTSTDLPDWTMFEVGFTVPKSAGAVKILITGEQCTFARCPMFGAVWVDEVKLVAIDQ